MKSIIYFMVCFLVTTTAYADTPQTSIPFKLDANAALKLVEMIRDPAKTGDTLKNVTKNDPNSDKFFWVNEQTNDFIDVWAVNPWTGDVWNIWSCEKFSNKRARKAQVEIRQRFTAEEMKKYKYLTALMPDCYGDPPSERENKD